MKLKNIIVLCLLVPLVASAAKPLTTSELEIKLSEQPISAQIDYFADLYGTDASVVKKVVQCESQGKVTARGDGNRAYGLLQYHKASFERHAKLFGEELDYYSSYDQIKLGTWAISQGYGNEWTAYRAIKNGGTYSFYSKLLKKHFVAVCK
jgi:hypothetical protein